MAEEIEIAPVRARTLAPPEPSEPPSTLAVAQSAPAPSPALSPADLPAPSPTPSPVLERIHALVRRGYSAELGAPGSPDRVVLRHLGLAPDLVLHSNGDVEGLDSRRPRFKRHVEPPAPIGGATDSDHLRFMRFLDTVPPVTFWHRNRPWRKKYLYLPLVLAAVWGLCVTLTILLFGG